MNMRTMDDLISKVSLAAPPCVARDTEATHTKIQMKSIFNLEPHVKDALELQIDNQFPSNQMLVIVDAVWRALHCYEVGIGIISPLEGKTLQFPRTAYNLPFPIPLVGYSEQERMVNAVRHTLECRQSADGSWSPSEYRVLRIDSFSKTFQPDKPQYGFAPLNNYTTSGALFMQLNPFVFSMESCAKDSVTWGSVILHCLLHNVGWDHWHELAYDFGGDEQGTWLGAAQNHVVSAMSCQSFPPAVYP